MAQTSKSFEARRSTGSDTSDAFSLQVATALDHCVDARWLGANSPLAAPYLLGARLDALPNRGRDANPAERGSILLAAMVEASEHVEDQELRTLIQNRYLNRNHYLSNTGLALRSGVSERTFYRLRNRAIAAFATQLYALMVPPLRLEVPAVPTIAGRRELLDSLKHALEQRDSIYLYGESGIGKSTLAAAAVQRESSSRSVFWFTVRPGFNDHFSSFVFALAYFLHNLDAPNAWRQLIADGGRVAEERVVSLLRYDFSLLAQEVVICVDEVDLLRAEITDQTRLLSLLEDLPEITEGKAALIYIGQRVVLRVPRLISLSGLSSEEIQEWLRIHKISTLSSTQCDLLGRVTSGSPLLLALFAAIVRGGEDVEDALATFGETPSLESLVVRIWRRLDDGERVLLMRLAVYQVASPADAWRDQDTQLESLIERGLASRTPNDLIAVSSQLKPLIYARIPAELRRLYHSEASIVLEERGNITGAMRQAVAAHDEVRALLLWVAEREVQIARGQGNNALEILEHIAATDLSDPAHAAALRAARAELLILQGRYEESEENARAAGHTGNVGFDAWVAGLLASALDGLGRTDHAATAYRDALELLSPPSQIARISLHKQLVNLYSRQRTLADARREAIFARVEADLAHGTVEMVSGNLGSALALVQGAQEIAAHSAPPPKVRNTLYTRLGTILILMGEVEEGAVQMQEAFAASDESGDIVEPLFGKVNLSWALTNANRPVEALAIASDGLERALRMKHPYLTSGLAAAAGEAAVYANKWEDAEHYLNLSLQQEEEFFRPWALTALGVLRGKQGRHEEAVRWLSEAVEESNVMEDAHGEAYALQPLFESQRALGDLQAARTSIERAHELYAALGMESKATETLALVESLD